MRIRLIAAGIVVSALLAGCASVVNGSGSLNPAGGSSASGGGHDFPSAPGGSSAPAPGPSDTGSAPEPTDTGGAPPPSGTQAAPPTGCPQVSYPYAHLSFDCITTGMTQNLDGTVWPLAETKSVETATGWVLEEGAGHWGAPEGQSLAAITATVRAQMVSDTDYGTSPKVTTVASGATKVAGVGAYVLQSTMTLNPTWAKQRKTAVKQEKLWIVALDVGSGDVSLWYTSIPDLASSLWAQVPAVIATIKVI